MDAEMIRVKPILLVNKKCNVYSEGKQEFRHFIQSTDCEYTHFTVWYCMWVWTPFKKKKNTLFYFLWTRQVQNPGQGADILLKTKAGKIKMGKQDTRSKPE